MAQTPLFGRLRHRAGHVGRKLGKAAMDELLGSQQRNEALEMAAKGMQEGRRLLDTQFEKLFAALGLATQSDLERLARKIATLRRRLEALSDDIEQAVDVSVAPHKGAEPPFGGHKSRAP